ncbi:MAG TPA: hypothetical protein VFT49_03895 [Candidatus Saccharimonadales bacterium]|nr:hypothetical protein [Candidatus Saccharimonadales bacterium]
MKRVGTVLRRCNFIGQIALGLIAVLILSGVAWAADTSSENPIIVPPDPEQATSQAERIIQRQTAYKVEMPTVPTSKVVSKCSQAQSAVSKVSTQDEVVYSTRLATYDQLAHQIADDITELKAQGVSNTDLSNAAAKYYKDVDTFLTDHSNYKAAIDDLGTINCAADPAGFEATVFDARKLRAQLAIDSSTIKSNIGPLQTALQTVKTQLENSGDQ